MHVETRTSLKWSKDGERAWIVLDMMIKPRGSGNRAFARRLGESFKRDQELKPFLAKTVVGTSRVTVHMRCDLALIGAMMRVCQRAAERRADPDQMALFAG